jgi:transposase
MVEGRSKQAIKAWLADRPEARREAVEVVAMDGVTGFKTATTDELPDAMPVMDPFTWCASPGMRRMSAVAGSPNGWLRSRRRLEGDERPSVDELSHRSVRAEIVPAQDLREEAQPPRMPASELDRHCEALVSREEALLRGERLPPDLNMQRRPDANVANPVGVLPPNRADNRLLGLWVITQYHRSRRVTLACLASGVVH